MALYPAKHMKLKAFIHDMLYLHRYYSMSFN